MPDHPADTADQPEDIATLRAALLAAEARIAALEQMIHAIQRARFGQSAERIDTAQLALILGQEPPPPPANNLSADSPPTSRATEPRQRNRGALPAHLERVEHVLDLADKNCHCCRRQMHLIGEDRTERLDVVPACPSSNDLRPFGVLCNGVSGPPAVKVKLRFGDASSGDAGWFCA